MLGYTSNFRRLSQRAKSKQLFDSSSNFLIRRLCVSSTLPTDDVLVHPDPISSESTSIDSIIEPKPSTPSISQKFIDSFNVKEAIESSHNNIKKKNLLSTAKIPKLNTSIDHYIKYKGFYEDNNLFNEERFKDQIDLEIFQFNSALHERQKITNTMLTMGKASDMKFISKHVLVWTKFLIRVIEQELEQFYKGENSIDRNVSFIFFYLCYLSLYNVLFILGLWILSYPISSRESRINHAKYFNF